MKQIALGPVSIGGESGSFAMALYQFLGPYEPGTHIDVMRMHLGLMARLTDEPDVIVVSDLEHAELVRIVTHPPVTVCTQAFVDLADRVLNATDEDMAVNPNHTNEVA